MSASSTARFQITSRYTFEVPLEHYEGQRTPEAILEIERGNAGETLSLALEDGSAKTTVEFLCFVEDPVP